MWPAEAAAEVPPRVIMARGYWQSRFWGSPAKSQHRHYRILHSKIQQEITHVQFNTCSPSSSRRQIKNECQGREGWTDSMNGGERERKGVVPWVALLPLPWQQWRSGCYGDCWVCVTIGLWPESSMQPEDTMVLTVSHTHTQQNDRQLNLLINRCEHCTVLFFLME